MRVEFKTGPQLRPLPMPRRSLGLGEAKLPARPEAFLPGQSLTGAPRNYSEGVSATSEDDCATVRSAGGCSPPAPPHRRHSELLRRRVSATDEDDREGEGRESEERKGWQATPCEEDTG